MVLYIRPPGVLNAFAMVTTAAKTSKFAPDTFLLIKFYVTVKIVVTTLSRVVPSKFRKSAFGG
jgi:hypothetical protein